MSAIRRLFGLDQTVDPDRKSENPAVLPEVITGAPATISSPPAPLAADSFPIPKFWEPSFWEQTVQIALRDYCKPGDIVFDVGANAGGLTAVMSRHVGPRGIVCSFEASPRIIDKTHYNIVSGGLTNVQLFYRAVYHTSHEIVTLYPGTHLNDSIYIDYGAESGASYQVETLALDDFVAASGLMPKFIKMDIEGAELDALKGAAHILAVGKPGLILEQSPSDMSCHALLTAAGYLAVDLSNYRRIYSASDFDDGIGVANILFIHSDNASTDPYWNASAPVEAARLPAEGFAIAPNGDISLALSIELPPGRYLCKADFTADGEDNEIFAGIDTDHGRIMRYHTFSQFMANTYRDWIFSLRTTAKITPYIQFVQGSDPSLKWNGAVIYRYPSFDAIKAPVIF